MQDSRISRFHTCRADEETRKSDDALFLELQGISALHLLSKISASPILKANAAALESRKQQLKSELNARRQPSKRGRGKRQRSPTELQAFRRSSRRVIDAPSTDGPS